MTEQERPEYEKCIRYPQQKRTYKIKTWCGNPNAFPDVAYFLSIDDAAFNAEQEGRLTVCKECAKIITELLEV